MGPADGSGYLGPIFEPHSPQTWQLALAPVMAFAFLGLGAILSRFLWVRAARKSYRQAKAFWTPTSISWDATSLRFQSQRGDSSGPWNDYYSWSVDSKAILLYLTENSFITIPCRSLSEADQSDIIANLRNAGVAERASL